MGGASKLAPSILSKTSGVSPEALSLATKTKGVIPSPKQSYDTAVEAIKTFRKNLSKSYEDDLQKIIQKNSGARVGVPEGVGKELRDIASEYNTSTKTRIKLPQNPQNMSAKELTELIKDINAQKRNKLDPRQDRILSDMKDYLKEIGIKTFGDEYDDFYVNYAVKKEMLDYADDIVKAWKSNSPTKITTSINRLQKVFDGDKEEFLKAIQMLERETGTDILSGIARSKTAPVMPNLGKDLDFGDVIKLMGFMVTSPRGALEINKFLSGNSGAIGKTIKGVAGLAPVLPGLSGTQGFLQPPQ